MLRTAQGTGGSGWMLRGTLRVIHQGYVIQNVVGPGRRCHSGFPELGTLLQGEPEKGSTHISQASYPWGVLSSGGRWCSSAEPGTWGHAW